MTNQIKFATGAGHDQPGEPDAMLYTAVGGYLRRAAVIGITWPVQGKLDDAALAGKLFAPAGYNLPRSKPSLETAAA